MSAEIGGVEISYADVRESIAVARSHGEKFFEQIVWQVEREAWKILGYSSWDEMRRVEYADMGVVAPRAEQPELVARLRVRGLTQQQIGDTIGVSKPTVHRILRDVSSETSPPAIVNARGQERPASYRPRDLPPFDPAAGKVLDESTPADAAPSSAWDSEPVDFERATAEFAEAVDVDPVEAVEHYRENLRNGITDEPDSPSPKKPRRRPITDQARDAGYDLRKTVEKVQRIAENDRFPANKKEVTAHLRGHLMYTVEVCQDLLDHHLNNTSEATP